MDTQQTPDSPTFEETLIRIATDGWEEAIADYFYPGLAKPKLVFDPTRTAGFFIDTNEWCVTMNLLQVPPFVSDEKTRAYIRGVSQHEIGHYDLCPYDGLLDAKLLSAAMKGVPEYFAPLVVNIFADLVIDTALFQRFPDLTVWRTQEAIKDVLAHEPTSQHASLSSTWKLLIKAYEQFWNVDLGIASIDCSAEQAKARRLAAIVAPELLDKESWPAKVKKIADLLKPTLEQDFTLQVGVRAGGGGGGASGDAGLQGPEDYERQFGDPSENKSREKVQGKSPAGSEADLERFAKGRGFKEFGSPARLAGLIRDGSTLAAWYRGRAKDLISIHVYEQKPGGVLPAYPSNWRIGDPLEDLDVILSAQVSPKIIPNITTRKWVLKEGPSSLVEKAPPDLLIVLDSSGSMNWDTDAKSESDRGEYDIAVVAAFAAAHFAFSRGCKVASLNFSDIAIQCHWTNDFHKVENTLLQYQGGGTVLPVKPLKQLVYEADRHVLVLIITDFGLNNFQRAIRAFSELGDAGNAISGFFIGADPTEFDKDPRFDEVRQHGICFYPVKRVKDLIGLVIEEIRKFY